MEQKGGKTMIEEIWFLIFFSVGAIIGFLMGWDLAMDKASKRKEEKESTS
jgi:hypothetical protein